MTDDPHIFYQARAGKVYDEEGNEAGTARTANGRDLERHADALEKAKKQRAAIDRGAKLAAGASIVQTGSHYLNTDNVNDRSQPFSKEEIYPIVELEAPRAGLVRAQFSADRYVSSSGWSEWRIYVRDIRTPDPEKPELAHLGPHASGIGDATRAAIDEAGRPLIVEWLASPAYLESRRRAAGHAVRRLFYDASAYSLDNIGRQLEQIAPELQHETLTRYRRALELRRESEKLLAETDD